jgi:hypothetical protein
MRKALLLTLLTGALAAVPCAHAQNTLEYSGIGTQIGGLGKKIVPRMPTQRIGPGQASRQGHGASPKTIVVPSSQAKSARSDTARKPKPAAVFLLKSGERIEAKQYLLTSREVQLTTGQQKRSIPLSKLDIPKTTSANRERGLDLRFPSSNGVVNLDF